MAGPLPARSERRCCSKHAACAQREHAVVNYHFLHSVMLSLTSKSLLSLIDVFSSFVTHGRAVASEVRAEVLQRTRCPCSAGAGASILLARLATKRAKPNGQAQLSQADAVAMLAEMPVKVGAPCIMAFALPYFLYLLMLSLNIDIAAT